MCKIFIHAFKKCISFHDICYLRVDFTDSIEGLRVQLEGTVSGLLAFKHLFKKIFFFSDFSLYIPGYLRTRSVNQTGLRLRDPSACLCLSGPGTKDLHHHTWHLFEILNSSFQALLLLSSVISKVLYTQLIHFSLDPSKHFSFSLWPHSCLTD